MTNSNLNFTGTKVCFLLTTWRYFGDRFLSFSSKCTGEINWGLEENLEASDWAHFIMVVRMPRDFTILMGETVLVDMHIDQLPGALLIAGNAGQNGHLLFQCPMDLLLDLLDRTLLVEMHLGQSGHAAAGCGGQCGDARHAGHAGQAGHAGGSRVLYFWRRRPPQCAHSAGRPAREPRRPGGAELLLNQHFQSCEFRLPSSVNSRSLKLLPRECLGAEACWEGGARYPPNPP